MSQIQLGAALLMDTRKGKDTKDGSRVQAEGVEMVDGSGTERAYAYEGSLGIGTGIVPRTSLDRDRSPAGPSPAATPIADDDTGYETETPRTKRVIAPFQSLAKRRHSPPDFPSVERPRNSGGAFYRLRSLSNASNSAQQSESGTERGTLIRGETARDQDSKSRSQPDLEAFKNGRVEGWVGNQSASLLNKRNNGASATSLALANTRTVKETRPTYGRSTSFGRAKSLTKYSPPPLNGRGQNLARSPSSESDSSRPFGSYPLQSKSYRMLHTTIDGDIDSADSPSSGSISFSPKMRKPRRRSPPKKSKELVPDANGLGLSFTDVTPPVVESPKSKPTLLIEPPKDVSIIWVRVFLFARSLAVIPAAWSFVLLMSAVVKGGIWANLYPWGIDTSREAIEALLNGWGGEGTWKRTSRGDMFLASAWVRTRSYVQ
jgi:hypothetical protein